MNKNKLGALIAGVSIAGAFGVKMYSNYKLLKGEEKPKTESDAKTEAVSEEDIGDFNFDAMFNTEENKQEDDQGLETTKQTEATPTIDTETDKTEENKKVTELDVDSISNDEKKNIENVIVLDLINAVSEIESPKEEHDMEINSAYKNVDIKSDEYWTNFENEINNENDK